MPTITLTTTTDAAGNVVGVGFQPAAAPAVPVAKRGPGRSRKQAEQPAQPAQLKKRGRPRKQAQLDLPLVAEGSAQ